MTMERTKENRDFIITLYTATEVDLERVYTLTPFLYHILIAKNKIIAFREYFESCHCAFNIHLTAHLPYNMAICYAVHINNMGD